MKLAVLFFTFLLSVIPVFGQARTAERIVSVAFAQLDPTGTLPNGSIRYVFNGTAGTTPCTGSGTGALALKVDGVWQCPRLTQGVGSGDVLGPSTSSVGELVLYSDTTGKNIGRSNTLNGIPLLTSGVVSVLASSGTGNVARATEATLTNPVLLSPTIASFNAAQHSHSSAAGGGQLDATTVFSSGTVPPARVIVGTITNSKCLRVNNVGQIAVAADDCGAGGGGSPGGVSGNITFNESGAFGGIVNSSYDTVTGRLTFNQKADGSDTFYSQRFTDTSPTGSFLKFRNAAGTTDLFLVSASGVVTFSSTLVVKNSTAPSTPAAGNTVLWTDSTDKNLKAQDDAGNVSITLRPISCSGTDKISSISSAGVVTCTADQGGAGTGVITLNTLNTSDQTFVAVDDANIDLSISSAISTHTITVAWLSTLSKARQHAATMYRDQSNTITTGDQSFAAGTSFTVPSANPAAPVVGGQIAYHTGDNTWRVGVNGVNRILAYTTGSQTFTDKTLDNSTTANLRDTLLTLQDNTDSTKTANFELSGITTGTNRVVSIANAASTTVQPSTATSNQWLTHIDSAGVQQKAQPSFANISGTMGATQGGTDQTAVTQGDLLYGSATNTWSRLAKSASATRYLANTGASNNPQWDLVNLANGVTGTLADGNLSANVTLLGSSIDLSGAEATGILAAARFPALTGDVTTSAGAVSTTIANDAVTNAKLANMATATFKGRTTAGTGDPEDLTTTQATALLNNATTTLKGLVPAPGSATGAFLRDDLTWVIPPGAGDMVLASVQTVTGAKTFDPAKLIVGGQSATPTPVAGAFYRDTDDTKLYWAIDGSTWGEVFVSGISVVNLASANVTGILPPANTEHTINSQTGTSYTFVDGDRGKLVAQSNGSAVAYTLPDAAGAGFDSGWYVEVQNRGAGTVTITPTTSTIDGAASLALTTNQGVRIFSDGTNYFTQRGVGGGGSGTPGGSNTQVQFNDSSAFGGDAGLTYNKTTDTLTVTGSIVISASGAGFIELAEGSAPSAVANRVTVSAPTDVTAGGWVLSLPTAAGTSGQFLQTDGNGVTTWATPSGSGTVTATGGALTANSVVLGAGSTDTKVVAGIITDGTSKLTLGVAGTSVGSIDFKNATSGTITLSPVTGALGTVTLSLPARTATVATTTGTLTSGRCVEIDGSGNFIQAAAACGSGGSGTINSGATNAIPKYTASTTIDDSLLSDDGTTLSYSGTGGFSLTATGGGYIQFTEGSAPSLVANTVQHVAAADAPAGGSAYIWGAAAGSGILRVANSSGTMTVTQDAGVSHLASSTSADLAGVLSDEQGSAGGFVRATSPTLTTPVLGVATATSINGLTITTSTGTLTIPNGVTATGPAASDTLVGRASTDTLTNKTYDTEGTGNAFTSSHKTFLPAAGCQNTSAASFWDLFTATPAVAACVTGTVVTKGVLDFADTSGGFTAQTTLQLPADFTGTIDAKILWTTTATTGNVEFSLATICTATDATATDDPGAFNTASTVVTAAPGVASRVQSSSITSLTITGCDANDLLHLRLFRDGNDAQDTLSATVRVIGVELTIRRAQ